jgi:hypothetical protein
MCAGHARKYYDEMLQLISNYCAYKNLFLPHIQIIIYLNFFKIKYTTIIQNT